MVDQFEDMHPDELKRLADSSGIAYLPLGTLEWHEEHLPFGSDAFVGYYLCKSACERTGGCVIPPLYFGTDREHDVDGKVFHGMDAKAGKVLPGSIYYLKRELFFSVLESIAGNVSQQGFRKLVMVSGHGGTAHVEEMSKLHGKSIGNMKIVVFHPRQWIIEGRDKGDVDHAGEVETSMLMAINEGLVHMDKLPNPYEGILRSDPHGASREKGKYYLSGLVDQLVSAVKGE